MCPFPESGHCPRIRKVKAAEGRRSNSSCPLSKEAFSTGTEPQFTIRPAQYFLKSEHTRERYPTEATSLDSHFSHCSVTLLLLIVLKVYYQIVISGHTEGYIWATRSACLETISITEPQYQSNLGKTAFLHCDLAVWLGSCLQEVEGTGMNIVTRTCSQGEGDLFEIVFWAGDQDVFKIFFTPCWLSKNGAQQTKTPQIRILESYTNFLLDACYVARNRIYSQIIVS